jgi:hypothetical protein
MGSATSRLSESERTRAATGSYSPRPSQPSQVNSGHCSHDSAQHAHGHVHGESRPRFESRTELACVYVSSRVSRAALRGAVSAYRVCRVPSQQEFGETRGGVRRRGHHSRESARSTFSNTQISRSLCSYHLEHEHRNGLLELSHGLSGTGEPGSGCGPAQLSIQCRQNSCCTSTDHGSADSSVLRRLESRFMTPPGCGDSEPCLRARYAFYLASMRSGECASSFIHVLVQL